MPHHRPLNPIRAATFSVEDIDATALRYAHWLDYQVAERGVVEADLARSWGAPACAGRAYALLRPASGVPMFLRLVQAPRHPAYVPLRSVGWAALELCVQNLHAVHERLRGGPFEVIGPPSAVGDFSSIQAMQVQGPDGEIVYLTEVLKGGPGSGLPTAAAPIDTLFIVVAGCTDLAATAAWVARHLGVPVAPEITIPYRMLARAFGLPPTQLHRLTTATFGGEIFLELDQYPAEATPRPRIDGELPAGIGLCTFGLPSLDAVPGGWITPPTARAGAVYAGRRAGTLAGPDGLLVELVETGA
jgi:hypothetical protein